MGDKKEFVYVWWSRLPAGIKKVICFLCLICVWKICLAIWLYGIESVGKEICDNSNIAVQIGEAVVLEEIPYPYVNGKCTPYSYYYSVCDEYNEFDEAYRNLQSDMMIGYPSKFFSKVRRISIMAGAPDLEFYEVRYGMTEEQIGAIMKQHGYRKDWKGNYHKRGVVVSIWESESTQELMVDMEIWGTN